MSEAEEASGLERRGFLLGWAGLGWLAFSGAGATMVAGMMRFMFPNVLFEPPLSFRAGFPEDYAVGAVDSRWKDQHGVWIVRTEREIYALLAVCTHLGCSPNWSAGEQVFKCPCHGSGFDMAGINLHGPAPRPLERVAIHQAPTGEIVVDKSRTFAEERGEWGHPDSYLVPG